jgi:VanZ family protein
MPVSSSSNDRSFRRTRAAGRWLAAFAWYGVIFAASSRPDLRVSDDDALDFVLRKLAHMAVFAVLAVLVTFALDQRRPWRARSIATGWLLTTALAVSDEWHQTFVHGRVGHASDVLIDAAGAAAGLAIAMRVRRLPSTTSTEPHP